ncbi:MAG: SDR family NAD(P)-dependent oxidoreductase [Myxococcota bacterium]
MDEQRSAVVLGVGPGIGAATARRFAREGLAVALMARSTDSLAPVQAAIEAEGGTARSYPVDATETQAITEAIARVQEELGPTDLLVYNVGRWAFGSTLELTAELFEACFKANTLGAFVATQSVLPGMVERGRGTLLMTGATASLRGSAKFAAFAASKFALRALAQSLAREWGPHGIHVAHVIIDGQVARPAQREAEPNRAKDTFLDPEGIAEAYWHLYTQDKTVWTHELDLRPYNERF